MEGISSSSNMPALSLNDFAKQELGYQPGTRIPAAEASKIRAAYQHYINKRIDVAAAAERPEFTPTGTEVMFPDGTTRKAVKTSPNSAQLLQEYTAPPPQYRETEDGKIGMIYPDGRTVYAWDANTGQPVKSAKKVDPFAALLSGAPQSAPVAQSGAATLEPPVSAPAPATVSAPAPAPQVYEISGQEDYAKVPAGATVNWNGQTFTKR
jgi:hypothetical protein